MEAQDRALLGAHRAAAGQALVGAQYEALGVRSFLWELPKCGTSHRVGHLLSRVHDLQSSGQPLSEVSHRVGRLLSRVYDSQSSGQPLSEVLFCYQSPKCSSLLCVYHAGGLYPPHR